MAPSKPPSDIADTPTAEQKRRLREVAIASRERLSTVEREIAAWRIAEAGIDFASPSPGAMISAYCAIGAELDAGPLLARLGTNGFRTCLPVLQPLGQPLQFRHWSPGEALVERKWGIREPTQDADLTEPDVLLVPLLAFDKKCRRIGYGGGYYDRTLAHLLRHKPITSIGLAYEMQKVDTVPCEPHDAPLDWIFTPSQIYATK